METVYKWITLAFLLTNHKDLLQQQLQTAEASITHIEDSIIASSEGVLNILGSPDSPLEELLLQQQDLRRMGRRLSRHYQTITQASLTHCLKRVKSINWDLQQGKDNELYQELPVLQRMHSHILEDDVIPKQSRLGYLLDELLKEVEFLFGRIQSV